MQVGLNRENALARLVTAFEGSQDDPLGAVLRELALLNEEAGAAAVAELLDAPDNQPSEKAQEIPPRAVPIEERQWGGYDLNPYYNPDACGLTLIVTAEEDEAYQFHYCCLWKDNDSGRYFMGTDSGCSCPTPFENFRSVSDLTEVADRGAAVQFFLSSGTRYTADSTFAMLKTIEAELPRW